MDGSVGNRRKDLRIFFWCWNERMIFLVKINIFQNVMIILLLIYEQIYKLIFSFLQIERSRNFTQDHW